MRIHANGKIVDGACYEAPMAACTYCGKRKGKRTCPALAGPICSQCCGTHRTVDISCPSDCRWLHPTGMSSGWVYDANVGPEPEVWRTADHDERITAIREHHRHLTDHVATTNTKMHDLMHEIVENQVAANEPPESRETIERLVAEGVTRHAAVHAVGAVIATEMQAMMTQERTYDARATAAAMRTLRAEDCK